ncbi:hypothetical protein JL107_07760 [Nakamurella flavida]|uniref:Uncharacterized protein n=1 Tax=Nakamurella flavida TaxID=363630 RepID=A0A938YNJ5_9ACTN|nr:hypothetical protein [Nakamurella flavida]MBM9476333.1 hypothetical protein [Nakamurella flavida]MDP9779566.1 hypothetical protein [Nakamurella flavida]
MVSAGALAVALTVGGPLAGQAMAVPVNCDAVNNQYAVSNATETFTPDGSAAVVLDPGQSTTVTVGTTVSATGTISASATAEAGAIFASASATVGISLSASISRTLQTAITATATDSRAIYQLGFQSTAFSWEQYSVDPSTCVRTVSRTGTGTGLQNAIYFKQVG